MLDALARHAIFVLPGDIEARGIDHHTLIAGIRMVDYSGFADPAVNNSWV